MVYFAKWLKRWGTLNQIRGKGGGWGKFAPFFLLPPREIEEEPSGAGGGPIRPLWASAAARGRGERRRGARGVDPRP